MATAGSGVYDQQSGRSLFNPENPEKEW